MFLQLPNTEVSLYTNFYVQYADMIISKGVLFLFQAG